MKDWVVRSVDSVATVHVGGYGESIRCIRMEGIRLMSRSMGSQHGVLVDVIGICLVASRVIWWESERVEVLSYCYDRKEFIVVLISLESTFNQTASD